MTNTIETLHQLADQVHQGDPMALGRFQEKVNPGLALVIRRALRTGNGPASLHRWIGRTLTQMSPVDGMDPSDALTLMLSNGLARGMGTAHNPETVPCPETVA